LKAINCTQNKFDLTAKIDWLKLLIGDIFLTD